jgi:succinate dehydrogenase/fumarate reductase flavoprotein subunit
MLSGNCQVSGSVGRMLEPLDSVDVVVVGGGFGGLVAAATAAEHAKALVVLEAAPRVGGTVTLSSGLLHMYDAPSWDAFRATFPTVSPVLGKVMFERFPEFITWLEASVGVPMARIPLPADRYGDPKRVPQGHLLGLSPRAALAHPLLKRLSALAYSVLGDVYLQILDRTLLRRLRLAVVRRLEAAVVSRGARIVVGARAGSIVKEPDGWHRIEATTPDGPLCLRTRTVVLATGGFQGSPSLLTEHLGEGGKRAMCRAARTNVGDGLRLGQALGADLVGPMDRFYGYPMPVLPRPIDHEKDPIALLSCSAFYAGSAVLVTRAGVRFVDEAAAAKDAEVAHAVATKADGQCWAILDAVIRERFGRKGFGDGLLPPIELIESAVRRGARLIVADTLPGLVEKLAAAGIDADGLARTLEQYNQACRDGSTAELSPPRTKNPVPVSVAPFYAIELQPGISMTYGGLRIDERAQVVDTSGEPLSGVYAVPGVAGGLYTQEYAGALAACGVFGRIAGQAASSRT